MKKIVLFFMVALAVIGCDVDRNPRASVVQATIPGMGMADSQATLDAAEMNHRATISVAHMATDTAVSLTRQTQIQTEQAANYQATDVAAVETSQSGTAIAVAIEVTRAAMTVQEERDEIELERQRMLMYLEVTQTAAAIFSTSESSNRIATAESDMAQTLYATATYAAIQTTLSVERERKMNSWMPIFLIVFISLFFGMIAVVAAAWFYKDRNMVLTVQHAGREVTLVRDPNQGYRMLPGGSSPKLLPSPQPDVSESYGEVPVMAALKNEMAILIWGAKDTGKTTLLKWFMAYRRNPVVLDPHGAPNKWPNCHVVGAGRRFDEIALVLRQIETLMTIRYDEIGSGAVSEGAHEHITLFLDEFISITRHIPDASEIIATLLTEARKVNIEFVMVSHSKSVRALGFEGIGELREGFAFIHLRMVKGQRVGRVIYGGDPDERENHVTLPGAFEDVTSAYAQNNASRILSEVTVDTDVVDGEYDNPDGVIADLGGRTGDVFIPQSEIDAIIELARDGRSRRAVCTELYGSPGGTSYAKVKWVLDSYGDAVAEPIVSWSSPIADRFASMGGVG